jgi:signal transduction histidine kinase
VLDTLGLKSALQAHCSKFSNNSHLPVYTDIDDEADNLPDVQKITIYRTLQEALNNILKHSGATQAWVELNCEEGRVTLTVEDNGSGFPDGGTTGGIGITTMRERLSLVGGTLQLRNGKNGGAILEASLPEREKRRTDTEEES